MRSFVRQLGPAVAVLAVCTVLVALYAGFVTAVAQVAFPEQANGQLVIVDGKPVGSRLIGQSFTEPRYFHPRPSAATGSDAAHPQHPEGYDAGASAAANQGPNNPELLATVDQRVADYRAENHLAPEVSVPVDAVTASGSGLDPHISVANARLQAPRVARARNLDVARVQEAVDKATEHRPLGMLGDEGVNVLELNVALDAPAQP